MFFDFYLTLFVHHSQTFAMLTGRTVFLVEWVDFSASDIVVINGPRKKKYSYSIEYMFKACVMNGVTHVKNISNHTISSG